MNDVLAGGKDKLRMKGVSKNAKILYDPKKIDML